MQGIFPNLNQIRRKVYSREFRSADIAWSFCRIPYAVLQGILEPNLIPSREFESRSREFGALPEIPTRRDFVGRRARLAAAALAGAAAASLASVHSAFDDVRLASQFESPPSTQSPRIRGWLGEPCLENRSSPKIGNRSLTSMPSYEVGTGFRCS
jgi:hypothetical protein